MVEAGDKKACERRAKGVSRGTCQGTLGKPNNYKKCNFHSLGLNKDETSCFHLSRMKQQNL